MKCGVGKRYSDLYKPLCYMKYQVSGGKAPKDSKPAMNHPYLTSRVAQVVLPGAGNRTDDAPHSCSLGTISP